MAKNPDIIAQLVALREKRGISQAAVAAAIGVDQAVVSNWETRKRSPKGPALKVLQEYVASNKPAPALVNSGEAA